MTHSSVLAAGQSRKDLLLDVPVTNRLSWVSLEKGRLEVDGHCLALVREDDVIEIPPAAFAALLLEPGVVLTHEAAKLCAENRTVLFWVGEGGARLYAVTGLHTNAERILAQATVRIDIGQRIAAARRLYTIMFDSPCPPSLTIEKLRGIEGGKVKAWYAEQAMAVGLEWDGRTTKSTFQQTISYANSCLYALSEIAILMLGYSPAIGIMHSGDPKSFVYDIADTVKFKHFMPHVFRWIASRQQSDSVKYVEFSEVRCVCRDYFRESRLIDVLVKNAIEVIHGHDGCDPQ